MANKEIGERIMRRLEKLGGEVTLAVCELPDNKVWRHIRDQLLRSGTAPGAHYSEAMGAQSRKDFIYWVSKALKEQREAMYWIGVCVNARQPPKNVDWLLDEGRQMVAILAASQNTARRNAERKPERSESTESE